MVLWTGWLLSVALCWLGLADHYLLNRLSQEAWFVDTQRQGDITKLIE